jgi:hypothetical protein
MHRECVRVSIIYNKWRGDNRIIPVKTVININAWVKIKNSQAHIN